MYIIKFIKSLLILKELPLRTIKRYNFDIFNILTKYCTELII